MPLPKIGIRFLICAELKKIIIINIEIKKIIVGGTINSDKRHRVSKPLKRVYKASNM